MATEKSKTDYIKKFIDVGARVGVIKTLTLGWSAFFFYYSTASQKKEFIDTFILLKTDSKSIGYSLFIIFCLVVIVVITILYYERRCKLMQGRIDELAKDRTDLQKLLMPKQNLATTKKKKP